MAGQVAVQQGSSSRPGIRCVHVHAEIMLVVMLAAALPATAVKDQLLSKSRRPSLSCKFSEWFESGQACHKLRQFLLLSTI